MARRAFRRRVRPLVEWLPMHMDLGVELDVVFDIYMGAHGRDYLLAASIAVSWMELLLVDLGRRPADQEHVDRLPLDLAAAELRLGGPADHLGLVRVVVQDLAHCPEVETAVAPPFTIPRPARDRVLGVPAFCSTSSWAWSSIWTVRSGST